MPRFVIQEHHASHLHWDFRLELGGVLKSWALPKGLPLKEGEKHLAVEVEDHPLDYIDFEGEIPEGKYGAGKVLIWDKGTYELLEEKEGKLKFSLSGDKAKGVYHLIRTNYLPGKKSWLIFKSKG